MRHLLKRALFSSSNAGNVPKENLAAKLNWGEVMKKASPEVHQKLTDIRARYEELRTTLTSLSALPQIPFARYKQSLPSTSPVQAQLSKLESEYQAYKEPPVDATLNTKLDVVQAERLAELKESKRFLEELEGDVKVVKSYLERLEKLPSYDEITVDQYFELFPEVKERIFKEIENDNWGVSEEKGKDHGKHH